MRWVRDEDDSLLVLGRGGCGLDFGTKIVGGGRGLRRSVFACLWFCVSEEGAQDADVEGAGALLVRCLWCGEQKSRRYDFVSYALPHKTKGEGEAGPLRIKGYQVIRTRVAGSWSQSTKTVLNA
jgi:hypothetical protein